MPPVQLPQTSQAAPAPIPPQPPQVPAGPKALAEHVPEQAKQLVEQYRQDPFRMSNALNQLKASYLAEHYHVTPNTVEG